jgi:VIT1/CCC1 family predicted Fe2+/Mn2+ transporter
MMGVAAAHVGKDTILVAGFAGLFAGAMSMAVGELVSVAAQRDAEEADIEIEKEELARAPDAELAELANIYVQRGLDRELAQQVARQLSEKDRLTAHLRDELGIDERSRARPLQAAVTSALSFAVFALVPILAMLVSPSAWRMEILAAVTLAALAGLGALGARLGGAAVGRAALRVTIGGALALAVTFAIGRALGLAV